MFVLLFPYSLNKFPLNKIEFSSFTFRLQSWLRSLPSVSEDKKNLKLKKGLNCNSTELKLVELGSKKYVIICLFAVLEKLSSNEKRKKDRET